ncbi:hypothetical protein [Streptomyces avermitilis]|uniref:hypothetical protein n=1 Tax=Streptomyces avermitilis TaxID=33903 RepID=UPI00371F0F29
MPLDILTDLDHGGRWTSLRNAGREWLWRREAPEREGVSPGDPFVDAGGLEECIPTVRGTPDHGHAWSRAWSREADRDVIRSDHFILSRTIRSTADGAESDYVLTADAGFRFVWAAHALLDLSDRATVHTRDGASTRLFPEAAPLLDQAWPKGAAWVEGRRVGGRALARPLRTAVGSARSGRRHRGRSRRGRFLLLRPRPHGPSVSRSRSRRATDIHRSVAQLGGFPTTDPYRSTGVEPMLGRVFDFAEAGPGDAARVPASGQVRWRLTLTTNCRCA